MKSCKLVWAIPGLILASAIGVPLAFRRIDTPPNTWDDLSVELRSCAYQAARSRDLANECGETAETEHQQALARLDTAREIAGNSGITEDEIRDTEVKAIRHYQIDYAWKYPQYAQPAGGLPKKPPITKYVFLWNGSPGPLSWFLKAKDKE